MRRLGKCGITTYTACHGLRWYGCQITQPGGVEPEFVNLGGGAHSLHPEDSASSCPSPCLQNAFALLLQLQKSQLLLASVLNPKVQSFI